jgi:Nif-specific regulatory protein
VVDYLKIIERPLNNLKLYISAKALNEVLLKKIEEKESALKIKSDESSISFKSGNTKEHLLIGKSSLFLNVLKIAEKSAQTDVNVLLLGEAGTGKTSIAKIIHCRSSRKSSVCNEFDCSTYADSRVFEQELFGSKGSEFINGRNDREGALESANGGTLILKRIEHLSVSLQAKLLSFLKDGTAQRLGDHRNYRVNVRIIATTNVDLKKRVDEGMFREDLFYTLGTIAIEVPALRQRQDDIEIMAYHFLNNGKDASLHKTLALGVVKALARHNWQGNIRELQNIMERAYILADGAIVDEAHISDYVMAGPKIETKLEKKENIYSPVTLEALEKRHICDTLEHLGGNKTKSAKMLGITVKTLYNKLHSYGMITAISPDA